MQQYHRFYTDYRFAAGDVVRHRRYNYRGVIVSMDPQCTAPDEWYLRNRTQPRRAQPWYHVLVHKGQETYVAEENLMLDTSGDAVLHPAVPRIFATFQDGCYYRASLN